MEPKATTLNRKVLLRDDFGPCVCWPKTLWGAVSPVGESCDVNLDGTRCRVTVQAERCNCRGTGWHEHRFLCLPASAGAKPNDLVVVGVGAAGELPPMEPLTVSAVIDEINEARLFGRVLPASRRRARSDFLARRQGLPGAYAGLFAPLDAEVFRGLPCLHRRAGDVGRRCAPHPRRRGIASAGRARASRSFGSRWPDVEARSNRAGLSIHGPTPDSARRATPGEGNGLLLLPPLQRRAVADVGSRRAGPRRGAPLQWRVWVAAAPRWPRRLARLPVRVYTVCLARNPHGRGRGRTALRPVCDRAPPVPRSQTGGHVRRSPLRVGTSGARAPGVSGTSLTGNQWPEMSSSVQSASGLRRAGTENLPHLSAHPNKHV